MPVKIKNITPGSPAAKSGLKPGMTLVSINGEEINDVLDYMFYADGDLGLEFDTFLMDNKRSCKNNCVFCFIDQLPPGLRPALYFKDDDSRLSFLQGNYITLTNLSEKDVDRIIKMRTPVNISVHTVNPALRSYMMGNPSAGEAVERLYRLSAAGVHMNCQLVLCRGINDGGELNRSLGVLSKMETVHSIACVPAGLTKFRERLPVLSPYDKNSAARVIEISENYGRVYCSDEFYLTAGITLPDYEHYGDFPQYENGVGMWAYMRGGFYRALKSGRVRKRKSAKISIATGTAAMPLICELAKAAKKKAGAEINVFSVVNRFFGESITVSGLLTAADIIEQLRFEELGEALLLSAGMFNADGHTLDGLSASEIGQALGVRIIAVQPDGESLFKAVSG